MTEVTKADRKVPVQEQLHSLYDRLGSTRRRLLFWTGVAVGSAAILFPHQPQEHAPVIRELDNLSTPRLRAFTKTAAPEVIPIGCFRSDLPPVSFSSNPPTDNSLLEEIKKRGLGKNEEVVVLKRTAPPSKTVETTTKKGEKIKVEVPTASFPRKEDVIFVPRQKMKNVKHTIHVIGMPYYVASKRDNAENARWRYIFDPNKPATINNRRQIGVYEVLVDDKGYKINPEGKRTNDAYYVTFNSIIPTQFAKEFCK